MIRAELAGYVVQADAVRTRETYKELSGGPSVCGCSYCRNFLAAASDSLPASICRFMDIVGIDRLKAAEVYELGRDENSTSAYAGEYYLWGWVETGPTGDGAAGDGFQIAFIGRSGLQPQEFDSTGALCLYFTGRLPWVLDVLP